MKLEIAAIENETKHKVNKVNKTWFQVWVGHLIIKNQVGLTTTRSSPILFLFSTKRERERDALNFVQKRRYMYITIDDERIESKHMPLRI
jgi:hypothetical protein